MTEKTCLIACLVSDSDTKNLLIESQNHHIKNAQLVSIFSVNELLDYLQQYKVKSSAKFSVPNLIILIAELGDSDTLGLIEKLNLQNAFKPVPKIIMSRDFDKEKLQMTYDLGVASVIRYSPEKHALDELFSNINDYWLTTVELPKSVN